MSNCVPPIQLGSLIELQLRRNESQNSYSNNTTLYGSHYSIYSPAVTSQEASLDINCLGSLSFHILLSDLYHFSFRISLFTLRKTVINPVNGLEIYFIFKQVNIVFILYP